MRRPRTNIVLPKDALNHVARERASHARAQWERHRNVMRFVQHYYSDRWERIEKCRQEYRSQLDLGGEDRNKLVPFACHEIPYCINCVEAANQRRLAQAIGQFRGVTPPGKEPVFYHIVATSPVTGDPRSWGRKASKNVAAFRAIVAKALKEIYGQGVGGLMSYQDFGERGFAHQHPHQDLTLSGWHIEGTAVRRVERVNLRPGKPNPVGAAIGRYAQSMKLGAGDSNVGIYGPWTGVKSYAGVLKYQVREMVDFKKIEYKSDGRVGWKDYNKARQGRITWMTFKEFQYGLDEYSDRLRQFNRGLSRMELTQGFGYMSKPFIQGTREALGREEEPHRKSCACNKCGDWVYDPTTDVSVKPDPSIWEDAS